SSKISNSWNPAFFNFHPAERPAMPPPTITTGILLVELGRGIWFPRSKCPIFCDGPRISPSKSLALPRDAQDPKLAAATPAPEMRNWRRFIENQAKGERVKAKGLQDEGRTAK